MTPSDDIIMMDAPSRIMIMLLGRALTLANDSCVSELSLLWAGWVVTPGSGVRGSGRALPAAADSLRLFPGSGSGASDHCLGPARLRLRPTSLAIDVIVPRFSLTPHVSLTPCPHIAAEDSACVVRVCEVRSTIRILEMLMP